MNNTQPISDERHKAQCTICNHAQRDEIDQDFVNCGSSSRITEEYRISRTALYRHAYATGLFSEAPKERSCTKWSGASD